jgi:mannose-6-phosphate isomerase-like protein (cupin superfamily)
MTTEATDISHNPAIGDEIRRVVVGVGPDAQSTVIYDGASPHRHAHALYPGVTVTELWSLHPGDRLVPGEDPAGQRAGVRPGAAGESRYYSVRIEPGEDIPLHVTPTVDYHVVVAGEVTCVLQTGEVTLRAGDVLVIQGAAHGWRTPPNVPFVSFAVMVGAPQTSVLADSQQEERNG